MKSELRNLIFTIVLTSLFFFGGVEAHSVIEVAVPDTFAEHGDTIAIPVIVSEIATEDSVYSFEMTLTFDSLVLTADSAYTTGTIAEGWLTAFDCSTPGQIHIVADTSDSNPLTGSGELVYVVFIVNGSQCESTIIHFDEMLFNGGDPAAITIDGVFFVGPPVYIEVSPDTSAESGDTIAIPVIVSEIVTEDSIYSFQMTLTFDSNVLTADSAYTTGTIAQGWGAPTFNDLIPGQIRIAMAGTSPLSGSGELVYVVFIVNGSEGDTTTIHFDEMVFNEGCPTGIATEGFFEVSPGTDVEDENEFPGRPTGLTLFQNYPNPFNPITVIQYALSHNCEVDITVYNITGQKIRTLVKHKEETGYRQVTWDGRNDEGKQVASGIYFYRLKAGEFTLTKRMLLLR